MRKYFRSIASGAFFGFLASVISIGGAKAAVLNFDDVCTGAVTGSQPGGCNGGFAVPSNYTGGISNVTVSYLNSAGVGALQLWRSGYNLLGNVAYNPYVGGRWSIFLSPAAGFKVNLTGFDLGVLNSLGAQTNVRVYDLAGQPSFDFRQYNVTIGTDLDQGLADEISRYRSGSWVSSSGIGIEIQDLQADRSVGIDNITFTVDPIQPVPVPVAGAGLPALLAFAGFAAWRRRRAAKA